MTSKQTIAALNAQGIKIVKIAGNHWTVNAFGQMFVWTTATAAIYAQSGFPHPNSFGVNALDCRQ